MHLTKYTEGVDAAAFPRTSQQEAYLPPGFCRP